MTPAQIEAALREVIADRWPGRDLHVSIVELNRKGDCPRCGVKLSRWTNRDGSLGARFHTTYSERFRRNIRVPHDWLTCQRAAAARALADGIIEP